MPDAGGDCECPAGSATIEDACVPVFLVASSGPLSTAANRMAVWSAARVMAWGRYINHRDPLNLSIFN